MLAKILILTLLFISLHADNTLDDTYYVNSRSVELSSIISNPDEDFILFTIEKNRTTKRIKTDNLIKLLKSYGYPKYSSKKNYTNFVLKSPIDTSKIRQYIKNYYEKKYEIIEITDILVEPRAYMTKLPKSYIVNIRSKNFLSRSGVLSIKTRDNKKLFFNYDIVATLPVYSSKHDIKKDVELSAVNSSKKSIILDKFRAKPIQILEKSLLQSKHHISKGKILTTRDVEPLSVVKKNSVINISLINNGMSITFSAQALQDGRVNDIIKAQKSDGKKISVRVTGKNTAEMK